MSIDRQRICDKVVRFVEERYHEDDAKTLLFLLRKVLLNAPEKNCTRKGDLSLWRHIKPHKSLFTNGEGKGLPIGDLVVQMAANLLLDDADHFITATLGITMARYVDDMILISESKQPLLDDVPMIREFLKRSAGVTLHPDKFYLQHYTKGVKFIGAVIKRGRTYISNRTVNNAYGSIRKFNRRKASAEDMVASVNSYLGIMRHHATYNIRKRLVGAIAPEWYQTITIDSNCNKATVKPSCSYRNRIKRKVKRNRI